MSDQSLYSRIYELKTQGLDALLNDLNKVMTQFQKLGDAKNQAFGLNGNSGADIAKSLTDITKALNEMAKSVPAIQSATASIKEFAAAANQGFTQAAKGISEVNSHLTVFSAGTNKSLVSFEAVINTARDYGTELGVLSSKLVELQQEQKYLNEELKTGQELLNNEKALEESGLTIDQVTESVENLAVRLSQAKVEIADVTAAMRQMNKVNNPGINDEQAGNKALDNEILNQRNQLLKIQAKEELATAGSINEARAQAALLRKELNNLNLTTDEGKAKAEEYRLEIEKLDTFVEENTDKYTRRKINVGNYPTDENSIAAMEANFKKLNEELRNVAPGTERFVELQQQLHGIQAELKTVGVNVKIAGESMTFFQREIAATSAQLIRFIPHMLVIGALYEAFSKIGEVIVQSIPGTDAYIERQEKLAEVNEKLAESFVKLGDEVVKYYKDLQGASEWEQMQGELISENHEKSTAFLKRQIDLVQALGVVNGEVYKYEYSLLQANNEKRNAEIRDIKSQMEAYKQLETIIQPNAEGKLPDVGLIKRVLENSDIPKDIVAGFVSQMEKELKDGAKISDVLQKALIQVRAKLNEYQNQSLDIQAQTDNAQVALESKLNTAIYNKKLELEKQLQSLHEQYREKQYQYDIAKHGETNESIIADTKAKYAQQLADLNRERSEFQKQFPANYQGADYLTVVAEYAQREADILELEKQETTQRQAQLSDLRQIQTLTENIRLAQNAASRSEFASGFGATTYAGLSKALSNRQYADNLTAQKEWIERKTQLMAQGVTNFEKEDEDYYQESKARDQRYYNERLQLAKKYYDSQVRDMIAGHQSILAGFDVESFQAETNVFNGKGSAETKQKKIEKIELQNQLSKATETYAEKNRQLAEANKLLAKSYDDLEAAKTKYGEKAPEAQAAKGQYDIANNTVQGLQGEKAVAGSQVIGLQLQTQIQQEEKAKQIRDQILQSSFDFEKTIVEQEMQLWAKRDAYREQMAQSALDWNKKEAQGLAQSNQEKQAAEKANFIAEQQLQRQKIQDEKRRAEAQAGIEYGEAAVLMIVKALQQPGGIAESLASLAIGEGALAATFAAKEALISQAPAYAEGTGSHPGGLAWVGDGGESELVKIGRQFFLTPDSPTLVNLPAGSQVAPGSQLSGYLKPPVFNTPSQSSPDFGALHAGMQTLSQQMAQAHASISTVAAGMANMNVNFDTIKGGKAIRNTYFKQVKL